ncbi:MAG: hypothetical protein QW346_03000 [Candidatus Micrarchaeaceae archaeon]
MDAADFIERLNGLALPVFSLKTASSILQKPPIYTSVYLHRLAKTGKIVMLERGRYYLAGTDEYTIASRIIPNSYITGYAALEHYRLTTQITSKIQVVAARYHRPIKLSSYTVEFSKVKRDFIYGYVGAANGPVYAEPEKIFIDDLYLHGRQYYAEEFEYALGNDKINIEKLKKYALMSGKKTILKQINELVSNELHEEPRINKARPERLHA